MKKEITLDGDDHTGYGLVQLVHGDGKGKTTSAIGQAIRSAGAGKKIKIIFFDKGGSDHYSERNILDVIDNIDYIATGRDRINSVTGEFDFEIIDLDVLEAENGLSNAKKSLNSGEYNLVILDEINSTVDLKMLNIDDVIDVVKGRKLGVEVILTGRNPALKLLEIADLVTEMKMKKHYFYSGVKARKGLDY